MKNIVCTPGVWDLCLHDEKHTIGLMRFVFHTASRIHLTFNKGWVTVFQVKNCLFEKLFHEYSLNPVSISFNRTR